MVLATVLVYLLQVAPFRSWVGPIIIMCTVPLGLIGVVFMLYLTNTTLNVQSEMGAIFLVGIEGNTGVLIIEFANKHGKLGLSVREAVVKARSVRFRPIIMTFLACFDRLAADGVRHGGPRQRGERAVGAGGGGWTAMLHHAFSVCLARCCTPCLSVTGEVEDTDIEAELAD